MPAFLDYIDEVCPKRAAIGAGFEGDGGKGKEAVDAGAGAAGDDE